MLKTADFEKMAMAAIENNKMPEKEGNICPNCDCLMENLGNEYCCPSCAQVLEREENDDGAEKEVVGCINFSMNGHIERRLYGSSTMNYSRIQKKQIQQLLAKFNLEAPQTKKMPPEVLSVVAEKFNEIQKLNIEKLSDDGTPKGTKKFVKRGNIRNEIIGALIFYECIRQKVARQERDIVIFMGLNSTGFSQGKTILRGLAADGYYELPDTQGAARDFVIRYLTNLNIPLEHTNTVLDIVEYSNKMGIYINSNKSTKIVGAIWYLAQKLKLPVTHEDIEKHCDNIKRNTYIKFCRALQ